MASKTNQEDFVKHFELEAISVALATAKELSAKDALETKILLRELALKIDNNMVTKTELKASLELVNEKYSPFIKGVKWLAGAVTLMILGYFFQLFTNISQVVGK